jgi:hypothetical protein
VLEAHRHLEQRGLYQGSLKSKAFKKVGAAVRFETMRKEGVDPKSYTPIDYNIMHDSHSVEALPVVNGTLNDAEMRKIAEKKLQEIRLEKQRMMYEVNRQKKVAIENARANGTLAEDENVVSTDRVGGGLRKGMSDDELAEYNRKREEDVRKRENAPLDPEWVKSHLIVPNSEGEKE